MTITKTHCDGCGKTPAFRIEYGHEGYTNAAGSSDTRMKKVDLCGEHMSRLLGDLADVFHPQRGIQSSERIAIFARRCNWQPKDKP